MTSSPIGKKVELDKSRKKFFDDSKFDPKNQKYGLFSFPGTLAISNRPYFHESKPKKNEDGTVKLGPRNFLASHVKRGKTPDAYFSSFEYVPEKYTGQKLPFRTEKERADLMKKKHEQNWKPGGKVNESASLFPHEASEVFKTIKRKLPDGSVRLEPKNFYTSPPKKGSNTPGVTLGPYPEFMPDPFDRKEKFKKEKSSKAKIVSHESPFKTTEHGGKTFAKDAEVYGEDDKIIKKPKRSVSQKIAKNDVPFKPSNPSHGPIGNYPEYIPNPNPAVKRKPPSDQIPWKAPVRHRTSPSPSLTYNVKNLRSEFPMLRNLN
jgi:Domain of unknown function (DUF4586)